MLEKCASYKISHLYDCTKTSLGPSLLVQGRNYGTGIKQDYDTGNSDDKHVSKCGNINVELREHHCKIFFKEEYGHTIKNVLRIFYP